MEDCSHRLQTRWVSHENMTWTTLRQLVILEFQGKRNKSPLLYFKILGYSRKVTYLAKILSTMLGAETLTGA